MAILSSVFIAAVLHGTVSMFITGVSLVMHFDNLGNLEIYLMFGILSFFC